MIETSRPQLPIKGSAGVGHAHPGHHSDDLWPFVLKWINPCCVTTFLYPSRGKFTWNRRPLTRRRAGPGGHVGRNRREDTNSREEEGESWQELRVSKGWGPKGSPGPGQTRPAASEGSFNCSPPC